MCHSSQNDKTPLESRALPESVDDLAVTETVGLKVLSLLVYRSVKSPGNMLVRITGSDILLGATVGSSTAHRLRTNRILESEAAGKAESVMRVPRASTSLYPLQKGGMVSQSPSQGISGTVPEHTTYPLQYKHIGDL